VATGRDPSRSSSSTHSNHLVHLRPFYAPHPSASFQEPLYPTKYREEPRAVTPFKVRPVQHLSSPASLVQGASGSRDQ